MNREGAEGEKGMKHSGFPVFLLPSSTFAFAVKCSSPGFDSTTHSLNNVGIPGCFKKF
jgi:hypothetical protein